MATGEIYIDRTSEILDLKHTGVMPFSYVNSKHIERNRRKEGKVVV